MPIDIAQITPAMLDTVTHSLQTSGHDNIQRAAALGAVRDLLDHPDTRTAIADATAREHADMVADLPCWNDLSDLDKGAALMHLAKVENEGTEYAVENYPVKYLDDPRLTALNRQDACDHAARFDNLIEDMNGDEHERLYDLALNHEKSNR